MGLGGDSDIWTIGKLIGPVWGGLISALEASCKRKAGAGDIPRVEQDIPVAIVGLVSVICLVPAGWLMAAFVQGTVLQSLTVSLVAGGVIYLALAALLAAAVPD